MTTPTDIIRCGSCGEAATGPAPDGWGTVPTGVGHTVNLCADCIADLGVDDDDPTWCDRCHNEDIDCICGDYEGEE